VRASRATRVLGTVTLGIVFALVLGSSGVLAPDEAQAFETSTALTKVSGDVHVRHAGGDFIVAHDGDVLTAGDAIRTGPDGVAEMTYFEGSTVRLDRDSELVVETLATASDGGTVIQMLQVIGRSWHVVTKLIAGSSRYDVRTPTSTASVRGTIFSVEVREDADGPAATVTTSEGVVVHTSRDTSGEVHSVRVGAGQESTKKRRSREPEPARAAPSHRLSEAPSRPAHMRARADPRASSTVAVTTLASAEPRASEERHPSFAPDAKRERAKIAAKWRPTPERNSTISR
jgi:hypothetical protein